MEYGTLTGKFIELVKVLRIGKISIACIKETKWVGLKPRRLIGISFGIQAWIERKMELAFGWEGIDGASCWGEA